MANIPDGTFNDWQDTQVIHATEYKQEREMLRAAVNDNDSRLKAVETNQQGTITGIRYGTAFPTDPPPKTGDMIFRTDQGTPYIFMAIGVWKPIAMQEWVTTLVDNFQKQKITTDTGGVKLSASSASDNILDMIIAAGKGMHTFYAIGTAGGQTENARSIRGYAHVTDSSSPSSTFAYAFAMDYKNVAYTNYYDGSLGYWLGWETVWNGKRSAVPSSVTNVVDISNGQWYNARSITNLPVANDASYYHIDVSIDLNLNKTIRARRLFDNREWFTTTGTNGVLQDWKEAATKPPATALWSSANGQYMNASQTVTPTKKLSECNAGWILMWSDIDPPTTGNNYNWTSTTIPKFMGANHSGNNWSLAMSAGTSTGQADNMATKELKIYDDKIVGDDQNSLGLSADVVLRYVLEY